MNTSRRSFLSTGLGSIGCATTAALGQGQTKPETAPEQATQQVFRLYPVGVVEKGEKHRSRLRFFDPYVDALDGLEDFSHAFVLYWFDRNDSPKKRGILRVHPRGNRGNPLTGVFACRAPVRPNLIALSLCRILSVEGQIVRVEHIDAFDGSPILDIKPYIPAIDHVATGVVLPQWLEE